MRIQEATHDETAMALGQGMGQQRDPCYAEFFMHPKQDQAATKERGYPVFVDLPYVRIMVPGDKDNVIVRPARDKDKARFARQWDAFQRGEEAPIEGLPLAEWPAVTRSIVETLKYNGIRTVEDLAGAPDGALSRTGPGLLALKRKAIDYIKRASDEAPMQKLQEDNDNLRAQIDEMRQELAAMKAAPRRGRRKAADDGTSEDD